MSDVCADGHTVGVTGMTSSSSSSDLLVPLLQFYSQEHRCMAMLAYRWEEKLRSRLRVETDDSCLVCYGSLFHAAGPEYEKTPPPFSEIPPKSRLDVTRQ